MRIANKIIDKMLSPMCYEVRQINLHHQVTDWEQCRIICRDMPADM